MATAHDIVRKPSQHSARSVDYVGFSNLPNQIYNRCIKSGFEFTLMAVGQSGLGKSTFLNTLFLAEIDDFKDRVEIPPTVQIETKTFPLVENDVPLQITFVDTPGFGDLPLDVEFLRALKDRVNIIPVIAKSDTLTAKELILSDLEKNDIRLYDFPEPVTVSGTKMPNGDAADARSRVLFAVVGSNQLKNISPTQKIRVREYPWGTVEVENLAHNEFVTLRDMIIKNYFMDLIDTTKIVHYENFRIRQMPKNSTALDCDPFTQLEKDRKYAEIQAEEKILAKEKILKEKLTEREMAIKKITENLDQMEENNNKTIEQKRAAMELLKQEIEELRRMNISDSSSSLNRNSPPEKTKKKMGLFSRN